MKIPGSMVSLTAIILTIFMGCQDSELKLRMDKIRKREQLEERNIALVTRWLTEINEDNYEELLEELWSTDCEHYFNSDSTYLNYNEFKDLLTVFYNDFPAVEHTVYNIFAEGDKVTAYFSANTLHDMKSFGLPPTGKKLKWKAMALFQIEEGKIKRRWEVTDLLGLYEQLGMRLQLKQ